MFFFCKIFCKLLSMGEIQKFYPNKGNILGNGHRKANLYCCREVLDHLILLSFHGN